MSLMESPATPSFIAPSCVKNLPNPLLGFSLPIPASTIFGAAAKVPVLKISFKSASSSVRPLVKAAFTNLP